MQPAMAIQTGIFPLGNAASAAPSAPDLLAGSSIAVNSEDSGLIWLLLRKSLHLCCRPPRKQCSLNMHLRHAHHRLQGP